LPTIHGIQTLELFNFLSKAVLQRSQCSIAWTLSPDLVP
jgi:hypothetical protein